MTSEKPMTALRGVRKSWLTRAIRSPQASPLSAWLAVVPGRTTARCAVSCMTICDCSSSAKGATPAAGEATACCASAWRQAAMAIMIAPASNTKE
jgi:hypothetical protein